MTEWLIIFAVALVVFGPRRLPELGRSLGRAMAEFRRATSELSATLEREIEADKHRGSATPSSPPTDGAASGDHLTHRGAESDPL